jgi:RNA polymerase sigma factor (sigma-70 family)
MEVSALKYSGGIGLHGRSTLLRLQSDERLVAYLRKGNTTAFEVLVSRYESRLLAFCRHLLGSREDAEDVLQEVLAAAFNAILADDRPINVRPWLYRIARNRSLNHLRRIRAVGVDSMDIHLSENGASTADKVHEREEFRLLVGDIHELTETQKTALVLREMDALSYEQIAEAMETTVPSVKSLLVRARVSLAEAAEARLLSCDEVRIELGEVAEGLRRRPSPLVRRHLRACERCSTFRTQLKHTNKALAALLPIGPLVLLRKFALLHLSHSAGAGAGSGATAAGSSAAGSGAAGAGAAGSTAVVGTTVVAGSATSSFVSAGVGALATKAAAGLAAAALVTAGAVEVDHSSHLRRRAPHPAAIVAVKPAVAFAPPANVVVTRSVKPARSAPAKRKRNDTTRITKAVKVALVTVPAKGPPATNTKSVSPQPAKAAPASGRTQTQSDPTVLPPADTTATKPAPVTPTTGPVASAPVAAAGTAGNVAPTATVTPTGTGDPSGTTPSPTGTPVPASGTGTPASPIGTPTGGGAPGSTAPGSGSINSGSGSGSGSGSSSGSGSGSGSGPTGDGSPGDGAPSSGGPASSGSSGGATGGGQSDHRPDRHATQPGRLRRTGRPVPA